MSNIKTVYENGRPVDLIDLENPRAVLEYAKELNIPVFDEYNFDTGTFLDAIDIALHESKITPNKIKPKTKLEKRKADGLKNNPLRKFI